ncbi:MAG: hypothetical protein HYZ93_00065 [Candidatus Omnitrophica bacterium]|nr:hypothetical protein [Candidatus Omnitrophota bacterium]
MRSVFALPEEVRFRLGLRGGREEWKEGPLPMGALPWVVTEELASPRRLFYVEPLTYAGLTGLTLPQALADLTDLFA